MHQGKRGRDATALQPSTINVGPPTFPREEVEAAVAKSIQECRTRRDSCCSARHVTFPRGAVPLITTSSHLGQQLAWNWGTGCPPSLCKNAPATGLFATKSQTSLEGCSREMQRGAGQIAEDSPPTTELSAPRQSGDLRQRRPGGGLPNGC